MCVFWSGWNILKMREVITTGTKKKINNNKANNEGVLARETSHTADITLQFVKELIWKQHELNDIINLSSQNTHFSHTQLSLLSARLPVGLSLSPAAAACCYSVIWSRVWGVGMGTLGSLGSLGVDSESSTSLNRGQLWMSIYIYCQHFVKHIFQFTLLLLSCAELQISSTTLNA